MKQKLLWGKFFWKDWSNDQALRLSSLAAQGLWMRILCVAAEADPIGYVRVNGRALGVTDIAKLAGVTETECASLLSELDRNGVFSRDKSGTIYSRRMVRDRKSQIRSVENGKKGGNPTLSKDKEISDQDNPHLKGGDKAKSLEARIKNKKEKEKIQKESSDFEIIKQLSPWLDPELAQELIGHRRRLKFSHSPYAVNLLAAQLAKCRDPTECARSAILNNWKSIYPEKDHDQFNNHGTSSGQTYSKNPVGNKSRPRGIVDAAMQALAEIQRENDLSRQQDGH